MNTAGIKMAQLESGYGYNRTNQKNVLNPYVNFHNYKPTQQLHDIIVAEAIQMRGIECYYIEREFANIDKILGEDPNSRFEKAWKFAAYLNTFESFEGQQDFFGKFGFQSNDEVTLSINPNLFKYQVNDKEPCMGDLIYFPLANCLFEINWVEPYDPFYQVGKNSIRKIIAQKFIYSGEKMAPVLQEKPGFEEEFNQLDLQPVTNLDGLSDIDAEPYAEDAQVSAEADAFVDPFVVINGANDYFNDFKGF